MVDDRVIDIIKALGLEGLLRIPGREIDHGLITALVERWRSETHAFHMPHGSTQKDWENVCRDTLGFRPINDERKQLNGQRILIKQLL
ncbi:hypothetical protein SO802_005655 [Lithocarpus litseifolius]|uniref:Aminotransferase-like plant mobile domain-containing protein n=1 Tax=Lithocarpus litseifolius TaxID=425828 RepID=A0AAW2DLB1_9ROSI